MWIRKAKAEDLAAAEKIYAAARSFMSRNGNPNQWRDGYPGTARLQADLEKGQLHVCVGDLPGAEERTDVEAKSKTAVEKQFSAAWGNTIEKQFSAVLGAAEGRTTGKNGRGAAQILAVFVFFKGDEPNYRVIENGAWQNDEPYGVVHRIAVSDAARGCGAARFCLDWAAAQTKNLRIDTHADNIPMQRLIERCGFQRSGIIHVEDGSPRIAYMKTSAAQERRDSGA